jgi:hypothetical protein
VLGALVFLLLCIIDVSEVMVRFPGELAHVVSKLS